MKKKILGVLGGMGPQASIHFYELLIRMSVERHGARTNSDFPHVLIDNIPVPDLVKSKDDEDQTVAMVEEEARRLAKAGADVLAMPCNTMHLYAARFRAASALPFISMVEGVVRRVETDQKKKVGLLGTITTMNSTLYTEHLKAKNIEVNLPDKETQKKIGTVIHTIITSNFGDKEKDILKHAIDELVAKGSEGIILGCTELPLLTKDMRMEVTLYNSLQILAEDCCAYLYQKP
jgi:aspartate racemase